MPAHHIPKIIESVSIFFSVSAIGRAGVTASPRYALFRPFSRSSCSAPPPLPVACDHRHYTTALAVALVRCDCTD